MIRIDDTLLEEIGLISLPKPDRDQMLRQIYETLEMRVGMRLAERMSDQQLDEFERFIDTNDEAGALKWLEGNFPDYKQVVADELEKLKAEIKKDSSQILQSMQAQGAGGQPVQQVAPGQPAQAQFGASPAPQQFDAAPQPQPAQFNPPAPQAAPQQFQQQPPQPQPQVPQQPAHPFQPMPQPVQNDSTQGSQPQNTAQNDDQSDDTSPAPQQSGSIPPPPTV